MKRKELLKFSHNDNNNNMCLRVLNEYTAIYSIIYIKSYDSDVLLIVSFPGIGVGMTRDCSTLMVAQYFKRKREFVEIFIVSGSGMGIAVMSSFIKGAIRYANAFIFLQTFLCCFINRNCIELKNIFTFHN